jgi:NADP-dependent 3-hydroxy acid dehydrogenase YdfG
MSNLLAGKTAIITGASSGIGRATALNLVQEGASVILHARRKDRLDELSSEITARGGKAYAVAGDAGVKADIDILLGSALSWSAGGCKYDIVVVNAGRGLAGGSRYGIQRIHRPRFLREPIVGISAIHIIIIEGITSMIID